MLNKLVVITELQVGKDMKQACFTMWATLKMRQVWQRATYMYLSWALTPEIGEGMFFWYNDPHVGPGFSEVSLTPALLFSLFLESYACTS